MNSKLNRTKYLIFLSLARPAAYDLQSDSTKQTTKSIPMRISGHFFVVILLKLGSKFNNLGLSHIVNQKIF
ncbi:hypothetical protein BpHYR1_041409 [Brachionus plicatilis]|uniref:Uncharacterized protein n=1 Tax=Brachionus plicatilis TaxID=10195 RepID=A0A3M7QLM9_BRAPC|nr:hypothetical protein BpHYR1_041409 [Brachionus plicatilis]